MKILDVGLPIVLNYYINEEDKSLIEKSFLDGVVENVDNKVYCTIFYNNKVENILKEYLKKIEKITKGNSYVYEYELEVEEVSSDKIFIIHADNCKFYKCLLNKISLDGKTTLILEFNIEE